MIRIPIRLAFLVVSIPLLLATSCKTVVSDYGELRSTVQSHIDPHSGNHILKSGRVLSVEENYLIASEDLEGWLRAVSNNNVPTQEIYLDVKWTGMQLSWRFWSSAAAYGGPLEFRKGGSKIVTADWLNETFTVVIPVSAVKPRQDYSLAIYSSKGSQELTIPAALLGGFLDEATSRGVIDSSVWTQIGPPTEPQ